MCILIAYRISASGGRLTTGVYSLLAGRSIFIIMTKNIKRRVGSTVVLPMLCGALLSNVLFAQEESLLTPSEGELEVKDTGLDQTSIPIESLNEQSEPEDGAALFESTSDTEISVSASDDSVSQSPGSNQVSSDIGGFAALSLTVKSDSESTKGRHYTVTRYLDAQCNKPKKGSGLFRKKYARDSHEFSSIEIDAGIDYLFQVDYMEKRRTEDRTCSSLVVFQPQANHSYMATYTVSGQVSTCGVEIVDLTAGSVALELPEAPAFTCSKNSVSSNKNGVPVHFVRPLY